MEDLNETVFVAGKRITYPGLVAICEALAHEHFSLYESLSEIAGNIPSTNDKTNIVPILRQVIQQYFEQVNNNNNTNNYYLPPAPPPTKISKTSSEKERDELLKFVEDLDRQEKLKAEEENRIAAELLAQSFDEEYQQSQLFFCEICREKKQLNGCYTLECCHRFCEECLSGYICSKINSHEVNDDVMVCPFNDCHIPIEHSIIRGCTKELQMNDVYEKYCEFKKDTFIENELKKGCLIQCPTEHCNFVFFYSIESLRPLSFQCGLCNQSYCINCLALQVDISISSSSSSTFSPSNKKCLFGPGHAPLTCREQIQILEKNAEMKRKFEEWKVLNESSQRLFEEAIAAKGWKRCPSCGVFIERNEGCDHMTCRNCKCSFCYVCGKYDRNNPVNRGDCGSSCPNKKK